MKTVLRGFAAAVAVTTILLSNVSADVTGDTYTLGAFIGEGTENPYVANGTFASLTFSATTTSSFIHVVGDLDFGRVDADGNALDELVVLEFLGLNSTPTEDIYTVTILAMGREKGTGGAGANAGFGTFTNWVADGVTSAAGNPYTFIGLDVGRRLGGTDTLDVQFPVGGNIGSDSYEFLTSSFLGATTAFGLFGFNANTGIGDAGVGNFDAETFVGFGFADLAAWQPFGDGNEFSGLGVQYQYSVPEPSAAAFLLIGGLGFFRRRR